MSIPGRKIPETAQFYDALISETRARRLTLVHGDYSPKNILVYQGRIVLLITRSSISVIQPFDLGFALAHLLSKAHHVAGMRAAFATAACNFWRAYRVALGGVPWSYDIEPRTVRHALGCLLARGWAFHAGVYEWRRTCPPAQRGAQADGSAADQRRGIGAAVCGAALGLRHGSKLLYRVGVRDRRSHEAAADGKADCLLQDITYVNYHSSRWSRNPLIAAAGRRSKRVACWKAARLALHPGLRAHRRARPRRWSAVRDGDALRYGGRCRHAASNVGGEIRAALAVQPFADQAGLDAALLALDGTPNKRRLGANALLAERASLPSNPIQ